MEQFGLEVTSSRFCAVYNLGLKLLQAFCTLCNYNGIYFTDNLFVYYFTSQILINFPKTLYRVVMLFLIQFTNTTGA